MKLKSMMGSVVALTLGVSTIAYAIGDYYPPERVQCKVSNAHKLICEGFDRDYLTENTFTADLTKDKDQTFYFVSAVTYYTPHQEETSVFITYNDAHAKMVKLKSINTSIRPDLEAKGGGWKKIREDIYRCDASYMRCPITNVALPLAR